MKFSNKLLSWYILNKREFPWRDTTDPYFIWLSEIILQQTKTQQGLPYYLKFTKAFPTIIDLAKAKQDKVLKLWQGLGYYSRARNLHFTAKYIVENYDGVFPSNYHEILQLKGVGFYTAAAISSFCFGLPYAVVDGNVIRVLSRFFGIEDPYDTASGKKVYTNLAQDLLDRNHHAENNQAIMDFGASQCVPKSPKCILCPLNSDCVAYNTNSVHLFPVKSKKLKVKRRFLNYLLIQNKDAIILGKRAEGIWKGLYDLPFIEFPHPKAEELVIVSSKWKRIFEKSHYKIQVVSDEFLHKLSHQHIYAKFWLISVDNIELEKYYFVTKSQLKNYPVSRLTDKFFKVYNII